MPPEEQKKLEELEKKLYKKDSEFGERPQAPTAFEAGKAVGLEKKPEMWQPEAAKKGLSPQQKKKFLIYSVIGFVLIVGGIVAVLYISSRSFIKTDVILKIYGPQEIVSGTDVSYDLILQNKTKVTLKDARLTFVFPDDSESSQGIKIESRLGDILSTQEKRFKFNAKIFGAKDEVKKISAKLSYVPENISSPFENNIEFNVKIILVPIVFNFNLPQRAASDKDFEMSLNIINNSETNFANMEVKIDYPAGYTFTNADVAPTFSNNIWFFNNLAANEQKTIRIKGRISGAEGEIKNFVARIGRLKDQQTFLKYIEEQAGIRISSSLLVVFTTVNNARDLIVNAGDKLNYKIKYKNTTDANISNVTVKVGLDSQVLDLSTLNISFGYYDSNQRAVIWNESSVSDLKILGPQKEGELNFSVNVKKPFVVKTAADRNFTVKSMARIDAVGVPDVYSGVPIGNEDDLELKTSSIIQLNAVGYYKNNLIPNSGPIPPKVGQKTTYTIFWQVINYSNDLANAVVEVTLPSNIMWENKFLPSSEKLSYDQFSHKVRWEIGNLNAGIGIISPVRQVAFQISLTPSPDLVGREVRLLSESQMKATDLFSNAQLVETTKVITTRLDNDPFVGYGGGYITQ